MWYTQWKYKRLVDSGPIEWEEFKDAFLGNYFSCEMRELKVKVFINLKQCNMNVEIYSIKFTILSRFSPSFVSNPRDEMSRFVTGVVDLVKEDFCTTMLHNDLYMSRLMVYAQFIDEPKLSRISRNMKSSGPSEKNKPGFKKGALIQDKPKDPMVKRERGSCSRGCNLLVLLVGRSDMGNV